MDSPERMEESLRAAIVWYSRRVWERGWVANHDGNLSARLDTDRFLCTPTAVSKGDVTAESLLVVNEKGERLQGTRKVFSEWSLHRIAYRARPEMGAVLHAHPPTATGFAVSGAELPEPFMAEPVVSLGPVIPTVPYFIPGDPAIEDPICEALSCAEVVLLRNHGLLVVGKDLESCFLRVELVEHLCRIALVASQLGGARPLPTEHVALLAQKRGMPSAAPAGPRPSSSTSDAFSIVAEALRRVT